ncbi:MAG: hypothetical protein K2H41_01335 [Acetatifactor sp.]|nr:hypothetical protein [Acetatifactor sp.]MDE7113710.1 hypothetical protein [Acetatifactor sp.]
MTRYTVKITDRALTDMEEIYSYIAIQLQVPEIAMGQYNRIAEAIEGEKVIVTRVLYSACDILKNYWKNKENFQTFNDALDLFKSFL